MRIATTLWIVGAIALFACRAPDAHAAGASVLASSAGARLDSNLMTGGGTDDTAVLQRILDGAAAGKSVHLIVDGPALVSGLNIHSNTTVECTAGGGFYLKDNSSRSLIRNAHRSAGAIQDEHIELSGCFLNGNRKHQPSADIPGAAMDPSLPSNREKDGTWMSGLQFLGVNYLTLKDITLWNIRAMASVIANASYVTVRNVLIDHGGGPGTDIIEYVNTDGLNFGGPLRYVSVDGLKLRTGDDAMAFGTDKGPIADVTVSNVVLMDVLFGIRLHSTGGRLDRIAISNVVGTVRGGYAINVTHWIDPHPGDFGTIMIDNVNVERLPLRLEPDVFAPIRGLINSNEGLSAELNGGDVPLISVNAHAEVLSLNRIVARVEDTRPVLRLGPAAKVGLLNVDLSAYDPLLLGKILELDKGSHVDRMRFALDWRGATVDEGKAPIVADGGTIADLHWVDTPPMFVEARRPRDDPSSVEVVFSQQIKSLLSAAGVKISVDGKPAAITAAVLRPDRHSVRYELRLPVKPDDSVTWSYDAGEGSLQNLDGDFLHSVLEKNVRTRH